MSIGKSRGAVLAMGTAAATAGAADKETVNQLIAKIKDSHPEVRTEAWLGAGNVGAAAVRPLSKVMTDENLEVARAAKRALWQIVRHVGRPGAEEERKAVGTRLARLLGDKQPVPVRREVLWMLSEIGKAGVDGAGKVQAQHRAVAAAARPDRPRISLCEARAHQDDQRRTTEVRSHGAQRT